MSGFRFCFPVFLLLLPLRVAYYLYSCQARWQECQKKLGLPLFVLVINNIYSILKRVVQAVVGAMYCKLSQPLESNRSKSVVFARLCLSCFIY